MIESQFEIAGKNARNNEDEALALLFSEKFLKNLQAGSLTLRFQKDVDSSICMLWIAQV